MISEGVSDRQRPCVWVCDRGEERRIAWVRMSVKDRVWVL